MNVEPWTLLRQLRRLAGLTQEQAAAGLLTTGELSQIENGRVLPGRRTVCALCARYGADADEVLSGYAPLRQRDRLRNEMYKAAMRAREPGDLLDPGPARGRLSRFERLVYAALAAALAGRTVAAEHLLTMAWQASLDGAGLTRRGADRILAVEARVHFLVALACGRLSAALEWQQKMCARARRLGPTAPVQPEPKRL
ncbi:MAG: helix-turn-helix domain-containing protein [Alicyclobacillus shizuokensis]|nr:helix-turn-helix domain-containing protein [Alicyclobacillus shizuokensis]